MQDLQVCERCGAAVADAGQHRAWHASLMRLASEASDTRDRLDDVDERLREVADEQPGLVGRQRRRRNRSTPRAHP